MCPKKGIFKECRGRARPTNGSDFGSLRSQNLTLFVRCFLYCCGKGPTKTPITFSGNLASAFVLDFNPILLNEALTIERPLVCFTHRPDFGFEESNFPSPRLNRATPGIGILTSPSQLYCLQPANLLP